MEGLTATMLLGANWKEIIPAYLTQETAQLVAVIAGIALGLGSYFIWQSASQPAQFGFLLAKERPHRRGMRLRA